ncbi:hypothetical protein H9X77_06420 [Clostridium saudiense]|nr:hypothetical protein [Clostridium saudiense]
MKKFKAFLLSIILLSVFIIPVNASISIPNIPTADIYKEGIYHFEKGVGTKLNIKLATLDKPMTVIVMEGNNKVKYYLYLTKDSNTVNILLDSPLNQHTVLIVGNGEIAFTFEE